MKISLNWIKEFVNLDGISVDELVKRFGLSTAEVEGVEYIGKDIENVVVAEILTVKDHPNSDHLHILTVNDATGSPVQVVCGAPNVRVGLRTFFARVGGQVKGMKIKPAKLAGVESFGMCCGGNELGIEADTSGIVELDNSFPIGANIKDVLPVEDVLIEVDNKSLTNRPDLWGHYGIAREFSAIFKRELKPIERVDLTKYNNLKPLNIKVETPNCFRYCGLTVDNVTKKVSPLSMKIKLNYCGMRDINLLADITNYLMLELGQPMHAFDSKIVHGITVIEADKNIEMETLEHVNHIIESGSIVICDQQKVPVAIAGIKGGLKSGITDKTNSLLLESACFDSATIRRASRKIGLITDASLRYEKSLDPEMCPLAIERLVYLLKNIDNGIVVSSSLTDVYKYHYPTHIIKTDADFISRRGGVKLNENEISDILTRLGFKVSVKNGEMEVVVPSFRGTKDVTIKEDLVEEIFRMYGYDNIKSATMSMPLQPVEQIPEHTLEYDIKYSLASIFNFNEVHSYVWNFENYNKTVGIKEESIVHLMDASKSGHGGLRSHLLPSIIKIADENKNKFNDISIFEIGRTFDELDKNNLVNEKKKLAIVLASSNASEKELYFKLKHVVEFITKNLCGATVTYDKPTKNSLFHPVNSCAISQGENIIGEFGVLHPSISKEIDKRKKFAVLELDVRKLVALNKDAVKIIPTSKYQSVSIDYNFLADKSMPYQTIENKLNEFKSSHIVEHSLKDIYTNDDTLNGKISYTINVIVTPKNKTLESSDIEKFSNRLISHMAEIGLTLRS